MLHIKIQKLPHGADLPLPTQASAGAAGLDLHAAITDAIILAPTDYQLIPTGIAIALPHNYEAQIRPRSGLALKHGVTVLNSPGTIDADYRGEIQVLLINHGKNDFTITPKMRIAQMVVMQHMAVQMELCEQLPDTDRGSAGFGSTGS